MIQMLYQNPSSEHCTGDKSFNTGLLRSRASIWSLRPLRHPDNQHVSFGKTLSYMLWFEHREMVGLLYNMGTTKYVWHSGGLLIVLMRPSLALNSLCILIWPQTPWCSCMSVSGGVGITVCTLCVIGGDSWKGVAPSEWVANTYGMNITILNESSKRFRQSETEKDKGGSWVKNPLSLMETSSFL